MPTGECSSLLAFVVQFSSLIWKYFLYKNGYIHLLEGLEVGGSLYGFGLLHRIKISSYNGSRTTLHLFTASFENGYLNDIETE